MYSFEPSEDQKTIIEAARKFASNELRTRYREADELCEPAAEWIDAGWELGLLPASIPEKYGGFGDRSALTGVLAAEELAWGDLSGALVLGAPNLLALLLGHPVEAPVPVAEILGRTRLRLPKLEVRLELLERQL